MTRDLFFFSLKSPFSRLLLYGFHSPSFCWKGFELNWLPGKTRTEQGIFPKSSNPWVGQILRGFCSESFLFSVQIFGNVKLRETDPVSLGMYA